MDTASLLEQIEKASSTEEKVKLYKSISEIHAQNEEQDEAVAALKEALNLAQSDSDKKMEAEMLYEISGQYARMSSWDMADENALLAKEIFEAESQFDELSNTIRRQGVIAFNRDDADSATAFFEEARRVATENNANLALGQLEVTEAEMHMVNREDQEALNKYKTAIKHFIEADSAKDQGRAYLTIGEICIKHGKNEAAGRAMQNAIQQFGWAEMWEDQGLCFIRMAKLIEHKDEETAISHYTKAGQSFEKASNLQQAADAYYQVALLYQQVKKWAEMKNWAEKAKVFAVKAEDEMLSDAIDDSIETAEDEIKELVETKDNSGGGFFSKIKGIFGG